MSVLSPKRKNPYLDKINENLSAFFRSTEKFEQIFEQLSQLINGATEHINSIQRILGNTDDDDDENEEETSDFEKEDIAGEKLCELNENLNVSIREIQQHWSNLEIQAADIAKSVVQSPKMIRLFLNSTKNDAEFNNPSFQSELIELSNQYPIIGRFYYELCLEIQTNFLDLSNFKSIKHLASIFDRLSSRSVSVSVSIQIMHVIGKKIKTMTNCLVKHFRTVAIASLSFYFSSENRVKSAFLVHAAEYEQKTGPRMRFLGEKKINIANYEDDDDDDDEDEKDKQDLEKSDEHVTNMREKRFREFASIEYNGEIYMTPVDFLESIIAERPRPRIGRQLLTDEKVSSILYNTPPKHRGSKRFFRNLEDAGLISFSEFLFLWVILTKPHTQFEIAFAMFDTDGNQLVDKREFLVLGKVMSDKRMLRRQTSKSDLKDNLNYSREYDHMNTTLLLHLFGKNGRDTLNYAEFKRFMENLQIEVLEIEFTEFSHGFKTISDLDFAEVLLRYTDFDRETKKAILRRVKRTAGTSNGITFEQFKQFFAFLNNLEEFSIAMRFHQLSNKPISQAEFQRAVRISTGFELDSNVIGLIFRIFDADDDQHLSYDEFMAVMKDRLSRGFQTTDNNELSTSKFDQFKRCFRDRAKYESRITAQASRLL